MGTAAQMIAEARKSLGMKESPAGSNHNAITVWYNNNVAKIGNGAWCDMSISMWASKSGNTSAVCPGAKGYAYTVYHAQAFQKAGRWHSGTSGIKAGDILFYDWNGSHNISAIDHVGLVESVSGSTIHTIEGNRSDKCARFIADKRYVVGYGRPAYSGAAAKASKPADKNPYVVSLQCTSQKVTKGKAAWILWNKENSDSKNQHSAKNPGILTKASHARVNAKVYGCDGVHYFVARNMKTGTERAVDVGEHRRNEVARVSDALYANEHLYIKFVPSADGTVAAWAKGIYW